jgi:protein MpaA
MLASYSLALSMGLHSQIKVPNIKLLYGKSVKGRPLEAWVIGKGSKTIMVMGGIHGDEIPVLPVTRLLQAEAKIPPPGYQYLFIQNANPDGFAMKTRTNTNGVDLNRNFDSAWSKESKAPRYFPGKRPLSEPESIALLTLIKKFKPCRILSIHAPLKVVNFDGPGSEAIAKKMAVLIHYKAVGNIGYPTPGSMGKKCVDLGIPLVTIELSNDSIE